MREEEYPRLTPRTFYALSKRANARRRQDEAQPALIAAVLANGLAMGKGEFTPEMFHVTPLDADTAERLEQESRQSPEQTLELFRGLNAYLGGTEVINDG